MKKFYTKEEFKARMKLLVRAKREREEAKRWEAFLLSREAFNEEVEHTLDVWELMKRNQDGCDW